MVSLSYSRRMRFLLGLSIAGAVAGFQVARPFGSSSLTTVTKRGVVQYHSTAAARLGTSNVAFDNPVQRRSSRPASFLVRARQAARRAMQKLSLRKFATISSQQLRRRMLALSMVAVVWLSISQAAFAVTGGRVGGSFGKSSSSSSSNSHYSAPGRLYVRQHQNQIRTHNNNNFYTSPPWYSHHYTTTTPRRLVHHRDGGAMATKMSAADVALLTGTTGLMAYGVYNNNSKRRRNDSGGVCVSPLGPGATVASVVVSLDVSSPDDPNSMIQRLRRLSDQATTSTREGVQDLVVQVCLELSRHERSMVSATSESRHFGSVALAEGEFRSTSVRERSKFDKESVNKFGSIDRSSDPRSDKHSGNGSQLQATTAVVSINIAIEGSTKLPRIRDSKDVLAALSKLASDAHVEDCLLSAEILWAPDEVGEVMTQDDVYADYPNLVPL